MFVHPIRLTARSRLFAILWVAVFINGCSSLSPKITPNAQSTEHALALTQWQFNGRLSISYAAERQTTNITWRQVQDDYLISLTGGPFNQLIAVLDGNSQNVKLDIAADDQTYFSRSPEELMQALLGWSLPLQHSRWWIRGVPDEGLPYHFLDEDDATRFSQAGWTVTLLDLQEVQPGVQLPARLRFDNQDLSVNLRIHNWTDLSTTR